MGFVKAALDAVVTTEPVAMVLLVAIGFVIREVLARFLTGGRGGGSGNKITFDSCAPDEDSDPEHAPGPSKEEAEANMVPLTFERLSAEEMQKRAADFYTFMNKRRTVRDFSSDPIPDSVVDNIIRCAGTAPSGAHTQPWQFVVVRNPQVKKQLRALIEEEEEVNYRRRMGDKWVNDLSPLKTDWNKPYIENAPANIVVLRSPYSYDEEGNKKVHYYHELSTGIACGMLVTAIHNAGLATVTSTPLNAGNRIKALLNRPSHEKVVLLLPVGYPSKDCHVPNLQRKPLNDIMTVF